MPSHAFRPLSRAALWAALAGCLPAGAQAAVFICRDAQGGTVTTDHLSSACLQYGGRELNPDGSVQRVILTPRQQQEQQQQQQRQDALRERTLRRQRERRALIARYPNDAVLQAAQSSDLHSVQALIDAAQARLQVLQREHAHLAEDAQFYPSGNYPADLRSRMDMNRQERRQELALVASQRQQMQRIRKRYAGLHARLRVLWARRDAAEAAAGVADPATR